MDGSQLPGDPHSCTLLDGITLKATEPVVAVQVHALSAGHFSLPEEQFVQPASPGARRIVPSLCFLIQHVSSATGNTTRIVLDLGLRRDVDRYSEPIRRHVATRQPITTDPDVVKSLAAGGLNPDDIDYVIYSHVHWDHIGDPQDFPRSTFVVGHGTLDLLSGKAPSSRGGHSYFEAKLLDPSRTIELRNPDIREAGSTRLEAPDSHRIMRPAVSTACFSRPWLPPSKDLPAVLDVFGDGSLYVVDAPGHLQGHINLLARVADDHGGSKWVYLAGDACHDRRIMSREKKIGEWLDAHGQACCIHADRSKAEETIERIRSLEKNGVEVIFAHDVKWESDVRNRMRFFGASH